VSEPQTNPPLEREDFGNVTVMRAHVPLLRSDQTTEDFFQQLTAVVEDGARSRLVLNCAGLV